MFDWINRSAQAHSGQAVERNRCVQRYALTATVFSVIAVNLWEFPSPLYIIIWIYEPVNQLLAYLTGT